MIIKSGAIKILADTIAAIVVAGEQSTIYTTGGQIPCSRVDAEYFSERWERWNDKVEEEDYEVEEEEDEEDE